jgi:hypothetical protein
MPIIGVSAQDYRTADDYRNSYGSNNNGIVESYSYEEPNIYNTDDGYNNNYDPSIGQQNSEYSSYNSYGPPTPDYGDGNAEYSSYGNSYEYPSNTGYMDDSYYPRDDPGSYGNQYNNYYEEEGSYDSSYYPPKKPQKFTCPDSGLVVDKPESCPVICPVGSTLAGHFVAAGSNLTQICNVDQQVLETCPADTDLEGVFVTDATEAQCNIFATCDATTPLGQALGLNATGSVEVADPQLCQLSVPEPVQIFQCPDTPNSDVPFLNPVMAGENVTSLELCQAATPAVQCLDGSTLEGVWVHPANQTTTCNIVIPEPIPTFQCDPDDPLSNATVTDPRLCEFEDINLVTCPATPTANVTNPNPDLAGANVTDFMLCEAPTGPNICGELTDLAGVFVNNTATDCDLPASDAFFGECLKCADLAIFQGGNAPQVDASSDLIGNATNNVFTVCRSDDVRTAFNETITLSNANQENDIQRAFDRCIDNVEAANGNGFQAAVFQAKSSSLQENSLTTNVKTEAEIPFSEKMSPPSVPATGGSSSAIEKMTKLKQQWLDLLP